MCEQNTTVAICLIPHSREIKCSRNCSLPQRMKYCQSSGMLFFFFKISLIEYNFMYQRTNVLLVLGITWLGIITPCLQMAFAYLYFRLGHIWSRVLNAELDKETKNEGSHQCLRSFRTIKHLLTRRTLY